ncbi:MAG: SCP2 sterol-binding domain-containing protein [Chloroflexota bacterium]
MPTYTSVPAIFENLCTVFLPEKAQNDSATFQFDLAGDGGGKYWLKVANGTCESGAGDAPSPADMTLLTSTTDWLAVVNGELNAMTAFMAGKVKVQGNMGMALKLQSWFKLG